MMTIVTPGVVLTRRPHGEFDQVAALYTEALGKVWARFVGVRRPRGKLKALAEPMTHGEYRLYLRPNSEWATATGGRIMSSHPGLRADFGLTCGGLRLCELLLRVAPDRSPNPAKYRLLASALETLESSRSPWVPAAFGLRLLDSAGFGLDEARAAREDRALWRVLHEASWEAVASLPEEPASRRRVEDVLEQALERLLELPLRTTLFSRSVAAAACPPEPARLT